MLRRRRQPVVAVDVDTVDPAPRTCFSCDWIKKILCDARGTLQPGRNERVFGDFWLQTDPWRHCNNASKASICLARPTSRGGPNVCHPLHIMMAVSVPLS